MRRYEIRISNEAYADLASTFAYIQQDSPQNAAGMVDWLLRDIESVESLPHRHTIYRRSPRVDRVVRAMPVQPYIVYYRVIEDPCLVRVLTIRHGARRQPRRFE